MKRNLLFAGIFCILAGGSCLLYAHYESSRLSDRSSTQSAASVVSIATATTTSSAIKTQVNGMNFEIVTSQADQQQGLGGRAVIPDNYAMLFVFPQDGSYGFWMKDMLTSIDMIWLSDNGTIVGIDSSVSPSTYPNVFYPPQPIKYVLETRAGFAQEKNWKIGTVVALPLPYGK